MKKIKFLVVLAILAVSSLSLSAQQRDHHGISLQLGGVLPLQEFSATPAHVIPGINDPQFNHHGAAMFGASFGLKYNYVFDFGLGVFVSADAMWNAMNRNIRTTYDNASCTKPMYVNVPIIVGANYVTDFSDVVDVWAEAGVGVNLFYKTTEGWSNALVKYDMNCNFAAEAGVGVTFIDLISIGAHYYWLGNQSVKVQGITYDETYVTPSKMKMGAMMFKLGFHF